MPNGLCNGTRLILKAFKNIILLHKLLVMLGAHIHSKIHLYPHEDHVHPFRLKRKIIPNPHSFTVTINKDEQSNHSECLHQYSRECVLQIFMVIYWTRTYSTFL
jgi:hypothetical protein